VKRGRLLMGRDTRTRERIPGQKPKNRPNRSPTDSSNWSFHASTGEKTPLDGFVERSSSLDSKGLQKRRKHLWLLSTWKGKPSCGIESC
jgi:hypothetical protein